jgi:hypothetical protein
MSFDPYNRSLNIQKSVETPTLKVRAHLEMWRFIPSHSPTLPGTQDVTLELALLAHTFISLPWSRTQG